MKSGEEIDLVGMVTEELFNRLMSVACPDWFTEKELAIYLRLVDEEGCPITAGIKTWVARKEEDGPLPRRFLGDKPRFYRPDIIRWTAEETARQTRKLQAKATKSVTTSPAASKMRPTLTAAAS